MPSPPLPFLLVTSPCAFLHLVNSNESQACFLPPVGWWYKMAGEIFSLMRSGIPIPLVLDRGFCTPTCPSGRRNPFSLPEEDFTTLFFYYFKLVLFPHPLRGFGGSFFSAFSIHCIKALLIRFSKTVRCLWNEFHFREVGSKVWWKN